MFVSVHETLENTQFMSKTFLPGMDSWSTFQMTHVIQEILTGYFLQNLTSNGNDYREGT